ncbi:MAG: alginate O-acetyltransferase, partial [Pseudomonadota bacterium]
GTSYSAVPAFHFEGFLKQALSADVVNAAAIGQGPFKPMEDFLVTLDALTTPPSQVIWEIPERYLKTTE